MLQWPQKEAVAFTSEHSPQAVARHRSEVLHKMIHKGCLIWLTKRSRSRKACLADVRKSSRTNCCCSLESYLRRKGPKTPTWLKTNATGWLDWQVASFQPFWPKSFVRLPCPQRRSEGKQIVLAKHFSKCQKLGWPTGGWWRPPSHAEGKEIGISPGVAPHGATLTRRFGVLQKKKSETDRWQ